MELFLDNQQQGAETVCLYKGRRNDHQRVARFCTMVSVELNLKLGSPKVSGNPRYSQKHCTEMLGRQM